MTTRHFSFWCEFCPTRVSYETEVDVLDQADYESQAMENEPDCPMCQHVMSCVTDYVPMEHLVQHDPKNVPTIHRMLLDGDGL